jgi:hypothetical protein
VITLSLDTLQDDRFALNKNVVNGPRIRFYAGLPVTLDGVNIGTFCIADIAPKSSFVPKEVEMLREMAGMISDLLAERQRRLLSTSVDSARFVVSLLHGVQPALTTAIQERDKMLNQCPSLLQKHQQQQTSLITSKTSFLDAIKNFEESIESLSNEIEASLSLGLLSLKLHIDMVSNQTNQNHHHNSRIDEEKVSQKLHHVLHDWMLQIQKSIALPKHWSHHTLLWHTASCSDQFVVAAMNIEIIGLIITWLLRKTHLKWSVFDISLDTKAPTWSHDHDDERTLNGRVLISINTSSSRGTDTIVSEMSSTSADSMNVVMDTESGSVPNDDLVRDCDVFVLQFVMQALGGELTHSLSSSPENANTVVGEYFYLSIPCKMMPSTSSGSTSMDTSMDDTTHEEVDNVTKKVIEKASEKEEVTDEFKAEAEMQHLLKRARH